MESYPNPSAPVTGGRSREFARRDAILENARISCGRAIKGRSARSIMLLGLRGTGKTVLINEIGKIAQENGLFVSHVEVSERAVPKIYGGIEHIIQLTRKLRLLKSPLIIMKLANMQF